jgi:membrane protease YdiL (CAAX protease family)
VDQPVHADQEDTIMTWVDHAFAFLFVVVAPPAVAWSSARLARRIESGDARARIRAYGWGIAEAWALSLALLVYWHWTGRPFEALGLVAPAGTAAWISLGLGVVTVIFYATQVRAVLASEDARAAVRGQLSPGVRRLMPASAAEMRGFAAVSVTAGICEELQFRGFILWYFAALLPWGWAIAATVAVFGIGHAYQGARNILLTGAVGGIELAVYLWTGSLLAPIVIHIVIDLANGFIIYRANASGEAASGTLLAPTNT